jgi:hypothetical protein
VVFVEGVEIRPGVGHRRELAATILPKMMQEWTSEKGLSQMWEMATMRLSRSRG